MAGSIGRLFLLVKGYFTGNVGHWECWVIETIKLPVRSNFLIEFI